MLFPLFSVTHRRTNPELKVWEAWGERLENPLQLVSELHNQLEVFCSRLIFWEGTVLWMNIILIHGMRGIGLRASSGSTVTSGSYESGTWWLMDTQIVILDSDHLRLHKQSHMPENCCGCLAGLFMLSLLLRLGGQLGKISTVFRKPSSRPSLFSRTWPWNF